ncbi:peptidoglycan-binding protein [Niallia sp. NCCP-28]|uniref:peptidoglycan-binding protein n=1 Tax=Niallia sp. NCCP-28 TaxID=2934712 RepID=UPI00208C6C9A|nr:M15 family metallopeptidase [Niallia sp. NCCP-28]GKU81188.1 hypothetical protein NCCP28_05840 [Niallia sp. NCCP-28]
MSFTPTYHERNLKNLAQLGDNTKKKAIEWYKYLIENEIDVLIYETIRTVETQRQNVAKGASQTMKSYHIVGQALDFVMVDGKEALWNGYGSAAAKKAIAKAKALGFEWGGDWSGFVDKPHLQYNYKGYGTDTFNTKGDAISLTATTTTAAKTSTTKTSSAAIVPYPGKLIKKGSIGKDVERIQRAVNVKVDGDYGPATEKAVKAYQKRKGLDVDGKVGKYTWNMMF